MLAVNSVTYCCCCQLQCFTVASPIVTSTVLLSYFRLSSGPFYHLPQQSAVWVAHSRWPCAGASLLLPDWPGSRSVPALLDHHAVAVWPAPTSETKIHSARRWTQWVFLQPACHFYIQPHANYLIDMSFSSPHCPPPPPPKKKKEEEEKAKILPHMEKIQNSRTKIKNPTTNEKREKENEKKKRDQEQLLMTHTYVHKMTHTAVH